VGELKVDWQTLGVGFGSGLLAGLFVAWQWREIRRRRLARNLPPQEAVSGWSAPEGRGSTGIQPEKR
jgi:hypothetical protein